MTVRPQSSSFLPIYQIRLDRVGSIRYTARDIRTPAVAATLARELITEQIADRDREYFVALYLSAKNRPVGFQVISIGSLTGAMVHPREVFKAALLCSASAVIVAHNHPSGDPAPSKEDRDITTRLQNAAELIGVNLLDHLVIGHDGRYFSFCESSLL